MEEEDKRSLYLNHMFVEELASGFDTEERLKAKIKYVEYAIIEMDYHSMHIPLEEQGKISDIENLIECLYQRGLAKDKVTPLTKDSPVNRDAWFPMKYKIEFPHYDFHVGYELSETTLECAINLNEMPMVYYSTEKLADYLFELDKKVVDFEENYLSELKEMASKLYNKMQIAFSTASNILETEIKPLNLEYKIEKLNARTLKISINVDETHVYKSEFGIGIIADAMPRLVKNVKNYLEGKPMEGVRQ